MKLKALHLLLILIGELILCQAIGSPLKEGMKGGNRHTVKTKKTKKHTKEADVDHSSYVGPAGDTVDVYSHGSSKAVVGPTHTAVIKTDGSSEGIPAAQIPAGDEDLYILKSQVVPPVCPACPARTACPRQEPCAPCPPCARCPEPAFECKKVPNYNAISASNVNDVLPMPRLNSFARFN